MKIRFVADSDLKRMKGLMFQDPLDINECALFVFPYKGKHSFWNKNVSFPISLFFCNEDKEIIDIKKLEPEQREAVCPSSYDIKYVIEAHIDLFDKNKKGKKIKIEDMEVDFDGSNTK